MKTPSRRLGGVLALAIVVVAASTFLAATGTAAPNRAAAAKSAAQASAQSVLTILSGPTGPFVAGLSPFSSSDSAATEGVTSLVYEPLIMFNAAKTTVIKPWLASKYTWSPNGKKLTFTIPQGRTWSDGKPLTAADVAFTFNLIKKHAALNLNGIEFTGASAPTPTTAVITFAAPAFTQLYSLAKVFIVPQHIWSTIPNPEKYANPKPVGSGPYLLSSSSSQALTFTKNPKYWQKGLPTVTTVRVPNYTSQTSALNALSAGQLDWSTLFIADPSKQWTGKDSTNNKLWLAPVGDWYLCPNNAVKPFNNPAVRKALALSIDRSKTISQIEGQYYAPSSSPTGLRAGQDQYMPAAFKGKTLGYDPARARKDLLAAGFKGGSSGTLTQPDGSPFKVSLLLPSDYTDWMSLGQVFVNQMKAAGIDAQLQGTSVNSWTSDVTNGNYQLSFCGVWATDGPYTTFDTLLSSSAGAPVGKAAISNVSRFSNPKVDSLLAQYRRSSDAATQRKAIAGVATIIGQQAPIIPLMSVTSFGAYTTKRFTGWPSSANPYQTDAILNPYTEDVILHLKPAAA